MVGIGTRARVQSEFGVSGNEGLGITDVVNVVREDRGNCGCGFLVLVLVRFIYRMIRVGMYVTLNGLIIAFSSCSPGIPSGPLCSQPDTALGRT